jgi:dephospho-CoA kinase
VGLVLGLLGGIASGKSTVAAWFAEAGWHVVDADRIAREVTDRPEILAQIRRRFGSAVLAPDGSLDRGRLAGVVFADAEARRDLEALLHPAVLAEIERRLAEHGRRGEPAVLDVPLLLETGLDRLCTALVFVEVPEGVRRDRAMARGWTEEQWRQREAAQISLGVKRARSRYIVTNDRPTEETRLQVRNILSQLDA